MLYLYISVFVYFYFCICALNTWEYHFLHPGTTCFANKHTTLKDTQVGYTSNTKVWTHTLWKNTPQSIFSLNWTILRKHYVSKFFLRRPSPPRTRLSLQTPASNRVMKIETGGGAHLASIGNLLSAPKGPHTSWPKKLHLLQET